MSARAFWRAAVVAAMTLALSAIGSAGAGAEPLPLPVPLPGGPPWCC